MADAYDEAIEKRQGEIKKKFLETLREVPVIEVACKRSGLGRTTYYRWCGEDMDFARESDEAYKQGIAFINDMGESQEIQLIKEKKHSSIAYWLKHNSPRYGARTPSRVQPAQMPELSVKDARLFKHALALSSGTKNKHNYAKKNKRKKIG